MRNYLKVEGHANLVRDTTSRAVISTDKEGYEAYMAAAKKAKDRDDELNTLREELAEVKALLQLLLNKDK